MKYLIIENLWHGTYITSDRDEVKTAMRAVKTGDCQMVVNLLESTYFDANSNQWKEITEK